MLYLDIDIILYAQICKKFNRNLSHVHNIASQTMGKVYFETLINEYNLGGRRGEGKTWNK